MEVAQLFRSALEVERQWTALGYRFCFIGGVALQRWGEPRSTRDLDLTLMTGFGGEGSYIDQLLAWYPQRIEQARQFAPAQSSAPGARHAWHTSRYRVGGHAL